MSEQKEKGDLKVLDDLDEEAGKTGLGGKWVVILLIFVVGTMSFVFWEKPGEKLRLSGGQGNERKEKGVEDPLEAEVVGFAERFTIMAFNMSYTDVNHQVDKVANLMSDNMMAFYQEAFLDPKWVNFLSTNKAYVTYQGIDRSSIDSRDGNFYWVRVIGKNLYNSDARGAGAQIEIPFRLVVVVKNENGKLTVTNFQRL